MRYSQRIGIDCDFPYTDSDFAQFSDVAQRDHGRLVHKLESKCRKPANNSVSDGQNYLYIAEVKNKRCKNPFEKYVKSGLLAVAAIAMHSIDIAVKYTVAKTTLSVPLSFNHALHTFCATARGCQMNDPTNSSVPTSSGTGVGTTSLGCIVLGETASSTRLSLAPSSKGRGDNRLPSARGAPGSQGTHPGRGSRRPCFPSACSACK